MAHGFLLKKHAKERSLNFAIGAVFMGIDLRFLVLVVIFRKKLSESKTLNSLLKCREFAGRLEVLVWDNSPERADESEIETFGKRVGAPFRYVSTPQNVTLSRIYNSVISEHLRPEFDFLALFDDDSDFGLGYFQEIAAASEANPSIQLFLPVIRNSGTIASPAWLVFFKSLPFSERRRGVVSSRFLMAINSGMGIKTEYLKKKFKGYDEKLKFYGTDTYFMKEFSRKEKGAFVLRTEINHDLTYRKSNMDNDQFLPRYQEVKNSFRIIYKNSVFCRFFLFLHSLSLAISRRDMRFFK